MKLNQYFLGNLLLSIYNEYCKAETYEEKLE